MNSNWNRLVVSVGVLLGVGLLGCGAKETTSPSQDEDVSTECGGGVSLCGDQCVHTPTDPSHCGACFHQCGPGLMCVAGDCAAPGMGAGGSGTGAGGGSGGSGMGGAGGEGGAGMGGEGGAGMGGAGMGGAGGSGGAISGSLHMLGYQVVDAEYDAPLDKIILVSTSPNALHIHDPFTNTESVVPLPITPTAVSVAPDGNHAAVGHDGWVTYVNLSTAAIVSTLSVTTTALDVVLAGNGYIYVFPEQDQWEEIHCVNTATGVETLSQGWSIYAGTVAKLHPNGTAMYGADNGLSPSDIEKYGIANGTAQYLYDSPYHGDHSMCGDLWISEDGARIFTRCGNVFKASDVKAQDMTYAGSLAMTNGIRHLTHASETGKVAAIPLTGWNGPADADTVVHFYEDQFLQFEKSVTLPLLEVGAQSHATHGQLVFLSSDGLWTFVVIKADPSAGALNDFGIATL